MLVYDGESVMVVHVVVEDVKGEPSRIVGVYTDPKTACMVRDYMKACAEKTPSYTYHAESKEVTE